MSGTLLSLFSGIGGLDLAAEWAGFQTSGQVEISDFRSAILEKHWPNVPKWKDIHDVSGDSLRGAGIEQPTILAGGFPCQPFSVAGKLLGTDDDRYLWPEMLRLVQESRPAWIVGENVANFAGMALDEALAGLERAGYSSRAFVLPAEDVGARHERYRCYIVSHAEGQRRPQGRLPGGTSTEESLSRLCDQYVSNTHGSGQERPHLSIRSRGSFQTPADAGRYGTDVSYSLRAGWPELYPPSLAAIEGHTPWCADPFGDLWLSEPDVGRVADGIPSRVDRVESLGLAVVPQVVYPIMQAIAAIEGVQV